jgi:thioredoxin-like negative regulator of GroEL
MLLLLLLLTFVRDDDVVEDLWASLEESTKELTPTIEATARRDKILPIFILYLNFQDNEHG